jgi:hypothetical protein
MPKRKPKDRQAKSHRDFTPNLSKCSFCDKDLDLNDKTTYYNIMGLNICDNCATENLAKSLKAWVALHRKKGISLVD